MGSHYFPGLFQLHVFVVVVVVVILKHEVCLRIMSNLFLLEQVTSLL
jgi:hypothetical protein